MTLTKSGHTVHNACMTNAAASGDGLRGHSRSRPMPPADELPPTFAIGSVGNGCPSSASVLAACVPN